MKMAVRILLLFNIKVSKISQLVYMVYGLMQARCLRSQERELPLKLLANHDHFSRICGLPGIHDAEVDI